MGYSIGYSFFKATIQGKDFAAALKAINDLFKPTHKFQWLAPGVRNTPDLITAIEEWGFECRIIGSSDPDDNDIFDEFLQIHRYSWESSGEEEKMLEAIAPFLNPECIIGAKGEDGAIWRYTFQTGQLKREEGVSPLMDIPHPNVAGARKIRVQISFQDKEDYYLQATESQAVSIEAQWASERPSLTIAGEETTFLVLRSELRFIQIHR